MTVNVLNDWKAVVQTYAEALHMRWFLGAFAKLQKTTISFDMSVCPSVRPSA